jgi:CheY-like chemotaxis protein
VGGVQVGVLVQAGAQGGDGVDAAARAAAEAGARELARRAQGALMPRRLLLTVSDPARMAQVNLLIRSAGYDVRAAFDGPQALNLLRIERPDLLVLDYELHGIDGLEALRRLRQQSGGRLPLPVVLLLDAKHERLERDAIEAGARAVIRLPYDPVEFLDTVREAGNAE